MTRGSIRRLKQVDEDTGEILEDGVFVYAPAPRRNGFRNGWVSMNQDALGIIKQFTRVEDFRVLMALLERLDFENLIQVSQADVARDLKMDRAQVNRAIKRLIAADAIIEGPKIGISKSYRLNPNFGWKGSAKNHNKALDEERKRRNNITILHSVRVKKELERRLTEQADDDVVIDDKTLDLFENL